MFEPGTKVVRVTRNGVPVTEGPAEVRTVHFIGTMRIPVNTPESRWAIVSALYFEETKEPGVLQEFMPVRQVVAEIENEVEVKMGRLYQIHLAHAEAQSAA